MMFYGELITNTSRCFIGNVVFPTSIEAEETLTPQEISRRYPELTDGYVVKRAYTYLTFSLLYNNQVAFSLSYNNQVAVYIRCRRCL